MVKLSLPLDGVALRMLKAGDEALVSGVMLTARDEAHERLHGLIARGKRLPIELATAAIYYCGPTPARPGRAIGSCGPTTSSRMDAFTPALISRGLRVMIGKGGRSDDVKTAIKKYGCVYCVATGGLGALLATKVRSARVIAYPDLGPEAIHELVVEEFPVIVAIDSKGRDVYAPQRKKK